MPDRARVISSPPSEAQRALTLREAQARLLGRPLISIRARFIASLAICFFLCCAFALDTLVLVNNTRAGFARLGSLSEMSVHLQAAGEAERDLAARGPGVHEARMCCYAFDELLRAEWADLAEEFPGEELSALADLLARHRQALTAWESLGGEDGSDEGLRASLAGEIHRTRAEAASRLEALAAGERAAILRRLSLSANVPFLLLGVLLLLFAAIAALHARALRLPIERFRSYAERIARADFDLIRPARWYRDEFTDLALAVNQMLSDLQANQDGFLRSAKLASIGTLTSGIAHELNNPLNNVSITTESLMENLKTLSDEEKWRLLQDIYFETERASEVVKSLLDFTRQESPTFISLDLVDILQSTLRLAQNELSLHNVDIQFQVPAGLPGIQGAPNQLRQVFLNLFINAVQAMPAGGTLAIRVTRHREGRLCVEVQDTGGGIPPDILPRIFDPFFTTKEPGVGTGLGLSVSYSIILKHGGDIRAESAPGRGTTFHVCLPLSEE